MSATGMGFFNAHEDSVFPLNKRHTFEMEMETSNAIYGAVIGLMFCLTPIPVLPCMLIKIAPSIYSKYRGLHRICYMSLFLVGAIPFASLPFVLAWNTYDHLGKSGSLSLIAFMYAPFWWPFKKRKELV